MRFGIRLADWFGDSNAIVQLGVMAEKEGFDSCWVSHDVFMRSSLVTLTAIALNTRKILLGNTILNPYTINPAEIAMYLSTLDELSGGRVVCGISAGAIEYMDWLGIPHQKPLTRTREAVDLIRKLLTGEKTAYDGLEFKWKEQCYMRFKTLRPKIPVYIGGQGDKMLEYAGQAGDGVLPLLYPPDFAPYAVKLVHESAKKAGRDPAQIDIAGCVWISIDVDKNKTVTDGLKELVAYFGPLLGVKGLASIGLSHEDFERIKQEFKVSGVKQAAKLVEDRMLRLAIYGTPDDCIEQVDKLKSAGVNHVLFGAPLGPDPLEAIRLIGRKVIPYFKPQE
jgi:5,10-methylenetetrahydromethanopterin reductase